MGLAKTWTLGRTEPLTIEQLSWLPCTELSDEATLTFHKSPAKHYSIRINVWVTQEDGAAEAAAADEGSLGGDVGRPGAEGHQEALPRQAKVRNYRFCFSTLMFFFTCGKDKKEDFAGKFCHIMFCLWTISPKNNSCHRAKATATADLIRYCRPWYVRKRN